MPNKTQSRLMVIFKKTEDLQRYLLNIREKGEQVNYVPTMGALHSGHISLVQKAKKEGGQAIVSIFVNPTQFNNKSDYEKYPTSIDKDIILLTEAGCDILFLPEVSEVYPNGLNEGDNYDFGYLDTVLEGAKRPGHFKGVGQVVGRFIEIIKPDVLMLGQKDYQQCMVIKSLVEQMGLGDQVKLDFGKTVREEDGLAMSSRNRRLSDGQRSIAGLLYQCLVSIKAKQEDGDFKVVEKECVDLLKEKGFNPEYVALADADDLTILTQYDSSKKMIALIAAYIGDIRLIDNMILN